MLNFTLFRWLFSPPGASSGATTLKIKTLRIKTQHKDTQPKDTQHKDTQHKDTQPKDTQHKDTQHTDTHVCHYAECRGALDAAGFKAWILGLLFKCSSCCCW
jgi:hypothetical protein